MENVHKPSGCRLCVLAVLAGSMQLFSACASVQPSETSIADALAAPDGTELIISGAVVQQMDDQQVLMRDSSGQIVAEIDDSLIGELRLAPEAQLRIYGEVDRDDERSVLVAEKVELLN